MVYKKITISTDGIFTIPVRITGVCLVAGTDAATAVLFNSTTQAGGDDFCKLSAAANTEDKQRFGEGVILSKGLSVTLTGTSPILYIYYQ